MGNRDRPPRIIAGPVAPTQRQNPMTLNPRAYACLLATLLCLAVARPAMADGRADWRDYVWHKFAIANAATIDIGSQQCRKAPSGRRRPLYGPGWNSTLSRST
ncbi:MAG: hypothetical protein MO852_12795 [Candidatus Devosia euplotis]|nr:hypothetical protein [Candidatus Devosia euplotis]